MTKKCYYKGEKCQLCSGSRGGNLIAFQRHSSAFIAFLTRKRKKVGLSGAKWGKSCNFGAILQ